jgi:hypothetical protein
MDEIERIFFGACFIRAMRPLSTSREAAEEAIEMHDRIKEQQNRKRWSSPPIQWDKPVPTQKPPASKSTKQ